jgi:serine/threonine protein kinase
MSKKSPSRPFAEEAVAENRGNQSASLSGPQLESVFTPRVWNAIKSINPQLEARLRELLDQGPTFNWDEKFDPGAFREGLKRVLDALDQALWSPASSAEVVGCVLEHPYTKLQSVELWVRSHEKDDAEAICDCIALTPPPDILILRRLPRKGSQKIVFEASWSLYQKTVILKKLLSPEGILWREMNSSPLINEHPNIIKTYTLWNQSPKKEIFLVEDKLQRVLSDSSRTSGTAETALLLHDVASALSHLKTKEYVHGDVKPDNVGFDEDHFVLLDFGICRPAKDFEGAKSATGSLRTRSPELLTGEGFHSWQSDVWALGATVCCVAVGKFPLIEDNEPVPRISNEPSRKKFEEKLRERVLNEYQKRVQSIVARMKEETDDRIVRIVETMLRRNPNERPEPEDIVKKVREELPHAVPVNAGAGRSLMEAVDEARALLALWPTPQALERLPSSRVAVLRKRMNELARSLTNQPHLKRSLDALTTASSG